jgi:2',3'-cyclic-nucleotide 2'-phosphodiesterase (5'-nucleotidase family)
MRKLWLTFGLLGVVLQLGYSADPSGRWFRLTILHTNDTHGHLLPFSYPKASRPIRPWRSLPTARISAGWLGARR